MKDKNPTIIEFTDTHIKLVQVKSSSQPTITHCDVRILHEFSDAELTNQVVTLTRLKNVQSDQLIFVIPRRFAMLKYLRLPSQNAVEIKKMAGLQLVSQIPYNIEDVVYDCEIVEHEKSGYSQVLVMIVHKDVFTRYAEIFKKSGLHLSRAVLSSFGVSNWLKYQLAKEKNNAQDLIAVVNIDFSSTEVCFCENQKLIFSRQLNYGSKDLGVDNFMSLINQIDLSMRAYVSETRKGVVARCLIVSTLPDAGILRSKLESEWKIPVRLMSGFENIFTQKKVDLVSLRNQQGVSLTALLGLAVSDLKSLGNLAPQEIQERKRTTLRKNEWIKFALLGCILILLILSIPGNEYASQSKILINFENKIKAQESLVKEAEKENELVKLVKQEVEGRIIVSDIFLEINRFLTEEISIRSVNLDEKGSLSIQGYAQNSAGVNSFQAALVKSPFFKELNLEFATKRKIFNVDVVDFKIVAQLKDKVKKEKSK